MVQSLIQFGRIAAAYIILFSIPMSGQRTVLKTEEAVQAEVISEIDQMFQSADFIKKKNKLFPDLTGNVVVDVGIYQNGKVSSFFKVESNITDIDFLNFMSDYILSHRFNFKLPKKQRYKIRYTAKF